MYTNILSEESWHAYMHLHITNRIRMYKQCMINIYMCLYTKSKFNHCHNKCWLIHAHAHAHANYQYLPHSAGKLQCILGYLNLNYLTPQLSKCKILQATPTFTKATSFGDCKILQNGIFQSSKVTWSAENLSIIEEKLDICKLNATDGSYTEHYDQL